jgi:hypothetical protein
VAHVVVDTRASQTCAPSRIKVPRSHRNPTLAAWLVTKTRAPVARAAMTSGSDSPGTKVWKCTMSGRAICNHW